MPRNPSHPSVVRDLRTQVLKLTQAQLAERLGVQTVTVKGIENGAFRISPRLALALASLLNLDYKDIMANKRAILKDALKAQPLSKWDEQSRTLSDRKIESIQFRISEGLGDLLRAARDYAPTKLVSLISALHSALDNLAEEFGLEKAIKRVRKNPAHIEFNCPLCGHLFVRKTGWLLGMVEFGAAAFECPNGHRLEFRRSVMGFRVQSAKKPTRQRPSPGSGSGD